MDHPSKLTLHRIQTVCEKPASPYLAKLASLFRKAAEEDARQTTVFVDMTRHLGKLPPAVADEALSLIEACSRLASE